ncbi:MAG: Hpt domain-containing protein, partial [Spirochaetaceae bacterium]|nr:Hpt domain-containing protein [Spirochaetaceae bacterium]
GPEALPAVSPFPSLAPLVDVAKGIAMTGGAIEGYRKVLAQFYKDAAFRLPIFATPPPAETLLAVFAAQAHAIKGAAGTIGASEVSAKAAALEAAGNAGDTAAIAEKLPQFYKELTQLIEGIRIALEEKRENESGGPQTGDAEEVIFNLFSVLKSALEAKDMKKTDRLLEEIEKMPLDGETREAINAVSEKVLMGEYTGAIEAINTVINTKEH